MSFQILFWVLSAVVTANVIVVIFAIAKVFRTEAKTLVSKRARGEREVGNDCKPAFARAHDQSRSAERFASLSAAAFTRERT